MGVCLMRCHASVRVLVSCYPVSVAGWKLRKRHALRRVLWRLVIISRTGTPLMFGTAHLWPKAAVDSQDCPTHQKDGPEQPQDERSKQGQKATKKSAPLRSCQSRLVQCSAEANCRADPDTETPPEFWGKLWHG